MTCTVIYERGPGSWGACLGLPGVISVGRSREEVELLIGQAVEFRWRDYARNASPFPLQRALPEWLKSISAA